MSFLPLDALASGASELGIELSGVQLDAMDRFASRLVEANARFNLTRITDPGAIVTSHYLDSFLYLWSLDIAHGSRLIDVGAGAGFPGIPIKIARPDLHVVLLDSTAKKVRFMEEALSALSLEAAEALHGRAEEIAHDRAHRERYDVVVARALSELKVLTELCVPLARLGGSIVASKGEDIDSELTDARPIIGRLGGVVEKTVRTRIPGTDTGRKLVVIRKSKPTPGEFPRAYARIIKRKGASAER